MQPPLTIPDVPPRSSPKRWLAVLHLAPRECGNCKHFDRKMGQLSLSRIKHFGQVMQHVSPMEIGRPDPVGVLVRKQHALSPALEELHEQLRTLETQIQYSSDKDATVKLVHERAAVETGIKKLLDESPALWALEREIDEIEAKRESHVTGPEELWINYGQCNALKQIVFSGWNCAVTGAKKWA